MSFQRVMSKAAACGLAVAALLLAPAAASAQEQTAEGAHQFLKQVTSAGGVVLFADFGQGFNQVSQTVLACSWQTTDSGGFFTSPTQSFLCNNTISWGNWGAPGYTETRYERSDACQGRVKASLPYYLRTTDQGNRRYQYGELSPADWFVNWNRVAKVTQSGSVVDVREGSTTLRFQFPAESLATRVAFAMEFLRVECDPTAGTGF